MNRRDFIRSSTALTVTTFLVRSRLCGADAPAVSAAKSTTNTAAPATFTQFTPLRRNVGVFTGRGGTIGWLASKDGFAIVDTQFPDSAAICLAGLPHRDERQIDVVLNTHHHADHTSGNPVFHRVAHTIVAQANVPKLQFAAADRAEQDPKAQSWSRLDQQVYADTTFAEAWRHELGDEIITAQYFGPAHTNGDSVVMFEKANVVHVGDLVFNRLYPVIDLAAGASARSWIGILEKIVSTYPADAVYVFGHGNPKFGITGKREDLLVMRDYWSAVMQRVEKDIAAGKSRVEIERLANLPGFDDFHSAPPNRLTATLAAVYGELTGHTQ